MMLVNIQIWEDFQNQGYTNDRQQALDEAKEEAIKLTTQIEQTKVRLSKTQDTTEKF